jgi:hypothetical protein
MKKSQLKQIIRSTLCEIVKEESDSEKLLNMKIKNPETGDDIKLKSALAYDKSSQVYKVAKSTHDKAMQIIKKDSEKGNQDAPSSEPTKEPSSKPDKEKEKKDWEKSDEERIKDRETAKEKINQIPKETLKKFQDADREYEKAYDKAGASTGPTHAGDVYGSMAAYNFDKVKPKLADYAPKGYEDEYGEYRDLKNKASFHSDAEGEADKENEKEEMLSNNDWNDVKAKSIDGLKTYDGEDYEEMFKKSHADIDNGNITKETLPKDHPMDSHIATNRYMKAAKKQYDILINKAYDKNPDATKDALIKRTLDKEAEMKANSDELNDLKNKMDKYDASTWQHKDAKTSIEGMMGTSTTDLKFLQDKMGEKELASSIEKEKKERAYNKKSAVGKMLSKIGIGETMKKSELKSIIREEIQNVINEEFSNWKVTFTRAIKNKLAGDVKKGHVEVVKARGTSEAIKKACKKAGCEGAWMHVDVEVTKK